MSLSSETQTVIKKQKADKGTTSNSDAKPEEQVVIKEELIDIDESTLDADETLLMNETNKEENSIYKCNLCNVTFNHSSSYKRHYLTHSRKIYECDICQKTFLQENHLKMHTETHLSRVQTYHCEICYKTFPSLNDYTMHMKQHKNERPFECEACHRTFVRKSHLTRHVKIHSSNMPLFKCQICHKTYTQESSLKQHISKHAAYYEYECEVCHIKFIRLMDHVAHMKTHNEENSTTQTDVESIITSYEKLNPEVVIKQEWSKEATCMLIGLFRGRRELWDCQYESYRNRRLKNEAWIDIARIMNLSKSEVEKKMRCLVGQFQRERRKQKTTSDDDKDTRWFAYHLLSFLENRNKSGCESGEQAQSADECFEQENTNDQNYSEVPLNLEVTNKLRNEEQDKKSIINDDPITKDTYNVLRTLYNKISRDEYDIFGESIACNIRNLKTAYAKSTVKYHINNILYQAELGHYDQPPCFGKNSTISVNRASESVVSQEASTDDLDNMLNEL